MTKKKEELNLKGPDMLQLKAASTVEYLRKHGKILAAGLVILLVAIVAGIGINAMLASQQEGLRQDLAQVEKLYDEELKAFSESQESAQNELDELKLAQQKAAARSEEKAKLDRQVTELEARLAQSKPDHSESQQEFLKFFQNHKNSPAGWVAGVRYAAISLDQRQLEEASPVLEDVANRSGQYPIIHTQSRLLLIATLEDLEKFDEALVHAEQLLTASRAELKPRVLLTKGRLLVFKKDYDQAQQTLTQLIEQHADSQEAESAKSMMALLF